MDIRTEGVQAVLGGSAILKGVDIQAVSYTHLTLPTTPYV